MTRLDYDVKAPGVQFEKAERKTPDHMANILLLLGGCALATIGIIVCVAMACWDDHPAFQTAGIVGIVFICAAMYMFFTTPAMWQTVETITGHDLNQDGFVGAPQVTEVNFAVSERTNWMAQLPAPEMLCLEWARAALNGHSMAYKSWQGRFALLPDGSDGPDRYRAFRQALVGAEMATERGNHGITLTEKGIRTFTEYIAQQPVGTPLLEA